MIIGSIVLLNILNAHKPLDTCKWWKKGGCQYETDTKDAMDPNFVSCKAKGTNFNKLLNFFFNFKYS